MERIRFAQLSSHIESVALELLRQGRDGGRTALQKEVPLSSVKSLEHAGAASAVSEYVDLMERFQNALRRGQLGEGSSSPWPAVSQLRGLRYFLGTFFSNAHPAWMALFPNSRAREASRLIRTAWESFRETRRSPEGVGSNQECALLIGRTCHPPGATVAAKQRLFERLTALNLREMTAFQGLAELTIQRVTRLLGEKARFYRDAHRAGAAVVEVLAAE
jgi:hypothetical protein